MCLNLDLEFPSANCCGGNAGDKLALMQDANANSPGYEFFVGTKVVDQGRGQIRGELRHLCCAIYTRKSSEEGLDQEFNSLQAQREACEAFIHSQPVIRAWRTSKRERRYASSPRWS